MVNVEVTSSIKQISRNTSSTLVENLETCHLSVLEFGNSYNHRKIVLYFLCEFWNDPIW